MRLPRVLRTTSFRLTLLYAALFCASVLLLFGAMFWIGANYFIAQIDESVAKEIQEIETAARGRGAAGLREAVAAYAKDAPAGIYYLLQDKAARVLAGNVPALSPVAGGRSWPAPAAGGGFPVGQHGVRGRGVVRDDGAYLFVGVDTYELDRTRGVILKTFFWGFAATVLLAVAGGAVMSVGLLRRVEAISRASQEIVAGALSRRIAVRGTDDEFDHLAASLNAMLDRIQALMEGLQQVSSDIAHDLRTPLSRLRQRLEFARRRSRSVAELHAALDGSIRDVDVILETFSALLRIAQIEARTSATALAPLDLGELLEGMLDTYQAIAEERDQLLSGRIRKGLIVRGNRQLLFQLFSNLVENAIRHCPRGAAIRMEAAATPDGIEVAVTDSGPGIPADLREKVFQRFFRLERSRTTEGTGLGLTLARAITTLHGGGIELSDNRPGLRVRLTFPSAG